jgi:hypothetical protein
MLLSDGPSIVVCGFKPDYCTFAYPAYLILFENKSFEEAISETEELLKKIYDKVEYTPQMRLALKTLEKLNKILGLERLSSAFMVAERYNFGSSKNAYSDRIAWTYEVSGDPKDMVTASLYFLLEGSGDPRTLFKMRVEALGKEALTELFGEEVIEELERISKGEVPPAMKLVNSLSPGNENILYITLNDGILKVKCVQKEACKDVLDATKKLLPITVPKGKISSIDIL